MAIYLSFNTIMNLISRSKKEKYIRSCKKSLTPFTICLQNFFFRVEKCFIDSLSL